MNIEKLRKMAGREEIDYQLLLSLLSEYAHPRDKITSWLRSGVLVRVKKGLYIFSKEVAEAPYSQEILGNLIYGPSAISLQYALSFYGMIPERVGTVTSITPKRKKQFNTPVGCFSYQYLHLKKYVVGIELINRGQNNAFLIASREKALCDHIHLVDKKIALNTLDEMEMYLLQDLRVDENILYSLRTTRLTEICKIYQDARLNKLTELIRQRRRK